MGGKGVAERGGRQTERKMETDPAVVAYKKLDGEQILAFQRRTQQAQKLGFALVVEQVLVESYPGKQAFNERLETVVAERDQVALGLEQSGEDVFELFAEELILPNTNMLKAVIVGMKVAL